MKIHLDRIAGDPGQPRKEFERTALEALAASIEQNGLMQAITVRPAGKPKGAFWIVAGERRYRAHCLLRERGVKGFTTIEAVVADPPTVADLRIRQIAENVIRADLTLMEEARAYQAVMTEAKLTSEEAAKRLGLRHDRVASRLQLLNLAPTLVTLVEGDQLSKPNALELARLPQHADQNRLLQMLNRGEIGKWKSLRAAVDAILDGATQADMFGAAPKASEDDVAAVNAMERKIDAVVKMVAAGWRDGECIIVTKVSRDRAALMADKLGALRGAIRRMEQELRNTTAQASIVLNGGNNRRAA